MNKLEKITRKILGNERLSCLECVEKHVASAIILSSEIKDSYRYRLLLIGHLAEAAEESFDYPEIHNEIRNLRKNYQQTNILPDFTKITALLEKEINKSCDRCVG